MTGWLLIIILLLLGGILSTFGDLLGSRVGKARLSIFNLRPRRTAVLITVLTGSAISALSLGFMLLVSRQLRVGLFQLDAIQARINLGEAELKQLEKNLLALRRGNVVISSGQSLATVTLKLDRSRQVKKVIDGLLQKANLEAFRRIRPREKPNRQILLVPKADIKRLEEIITQKGTWVVNIRSAANVLSGEKSVYAFPEVRPNINVVTKGEVLARINLPVKQISSEEISKSINLLLASSFAEIKRRGSLSQAIQFDPNSINKLRQQINISKNRDLKLEVIALKNSDTVEQVLVAFRIKAAKRLNTSK